MEIFLELYLGSQPTFLSFWAFLEQLIHCKVGIKFVVMVIATRKNLDNDFVKNAQQ